MNDHIFREEKQFKFYNECMSKFVELIFGYFYNKFRGIPISLSRGDSEQGKELPLKSMLE